MHRSTSSCLLPVVEIVGHRHFALILFEAIERLVLRCVLRFLPLDQRSNPSTGTHDGPKKNQQGRGLRGREGGRRGDRRRGSAVAAVIVDSLSLRRRVGTAFMWRHLRTQHNYFPFKAFEAVCHLSVRWHLNVSCCKNSGSLFESYSCLYFPQANECDLFAHLTYIKRWHNRYAWAECLMVKGYAYFLTNTISESIRMAFLM